MLANVNQFIQPLPQVLHVGGIDPTIFVCDFGVLVQVVATHLQEIRHAPQLRQVKVQAVSVQCHFADIGTQAADAHTEHLERIVSLYLDYAELQAERKIPMSMEDWAKRLDGFLEFNGNELLTGPGKISAEQAKLHAETEYEKYRVIQDHLYESDFDRFLMLEQEVNHKDEV